jgi:hypothetical protein
MTAAHNAKILTTGIAIASTLGISTAYTINANAQILEKIESAQTTVPVLVANTPVVAPTVPGPATGPKNKKVKTTTPQATDALAVVDATPVEVVAPEIPPTTAPATSSSK